MESWPIEDRSSVARYLDEHQIKPLKLADLLRISEKQAYNLRSGESRLSYPQWFTLRTLIEGTPPW